MAEAITDLEEYRASGKTGPWRIISALRFFGAFALLCALADFTYVLVRPEPALVNDVAAAFGQ